MYIYFYVILVKKIKNPHLLLKIYLLRLPVFTVLSLGPFISIAIHLESNEKRLQINCPGPEDFI